MKFIATLLAFLVVSCATTTVSRKSKVNLASQTKVLETIKATETKADGCHPSGPKDRCVRGFNITGVIDNTTVAVVKHVLSQPADAYMFLIKSPGGLYHAALEIREAMAAAKAPVHCVAFEAYSAAFIILQGCDIKVMDKNSRLMMHEVSIEPRVHITIHNYKDVIQQVKDSIPGLEKVNLEIAEILSKGMCLEVKEYQSHVQGKNWFMNYNTAIDFNAIDIVVESNIDYIMTIIEG